MRALAILIFSFLWGSASTELLLANETAPPARTIRLNDTNFFPCPDNLAEAEKLRSYLLSTPFDSNQDQKTGDQMSSCFQGPNERRQYQSLPGGGAGPRPIEAFSGSALEFDRMYACFHKVIEFDSFLRNNTAPPDPKLTEIPADLRDPELALATLSSANQQKALDIITRLNQKRGPDEQLVALPFFSKVKTVDGDSTANYRFLVYIPGNPQQYVMFAGHDAGKPSPPPKDITKNVSVVAVVKDTRGKRTSYYKDHSRNWDGRLGENGPVMDQQSIQHFTQVKELREPSVAYTAQRPPQATQSCHACHGRGPLAIAFEGMKDSPFRSAAAIINGSMEHEAPPKLTPYAKVGAPYGPTIGPIRKRSQEWLDKCIAEDSEAKKLFPNELARQSADHARFRQRVSGAMNCAECHNGKETGRLLYSNAYLSDVDHIRRHVMDNDMPRRHKFALKEEERSALATCLLYEYFQSRDIGEPGLLKDWLYGQSCKDAPALSEPGEIEPPKGGHRGL